MPEAGTRAFRAARQPWLLFAALLLAAPAVLSAYTVYLLFTVFLYVALAQSWNLAAGMTGLVSLGHAAFLGLGAYAGAWAMLQMGAPFGAALAAGGAAAAAFAAAIAVPVFRFRGIYFTIGTLVVAEALRLWMIAWPAAGAANGLHLPVASLPGPTALYYVALALAAGATTAVAAIMRSRLGLALNAIRDNEDAARTLGVNVFRAKLASLIASSFIAGVAGAVWAAKLAYIEPFSIFNISWTIAMVNMVIVGGIGTLAGPAVGAMFVVFLSHELGDYYAVQVILTGIVLILVIRFAPNGIWGTLRDSSLTQRARMYLGASGVDRP